MQLGTSGRSVWVLLVVALFLAAWIAWLFGARVPMYAVSDTAVLTSPTQLTATLPPDALLKIQTGQTALLRLDAFPWEEYGTISATVAEIDETLQDGRFQIQLRLNPIADTRIPFQAGLTGSVEIEIEQVAPAAMLLRTSAN